VLLKVIACAVFCSGSYLEEIGGSVKLVMTAVVETIDADAEYRQGRGAFIATVGRRRCPVVSTRASW